MSQNSTANSTPKINAEQAYTSFHSEVQKEKFKNIKELVLKAETQLERLTNERFRNPYDVLLLDMEASEEEIKKQYKAFSRILHPDKCRDERAKDSFHVVEQAYKTLINEEKRKVYLRIMREAKERTEYERSKENRKRQKNGQPDLPEDTFTAEYKENLEKIFDEIEEKKVHLAKMKESEKMQKIEELESKSLINQYKIYTEDEWETTRENRVNNWRKFSQKKAVIGTKKSNKGIKAPSLKQEERPDYAPKVDNTGKVLGIDEDYKKKWK